MLCWVLRSTQCLWSFELCTSFFKMNPVPAPFGMKRNLSFETAARTALGFLSPQIVIENLLETLPPVFSVLRLLVEAQLLHFLVIAEIPGWKSGRNQLKCTLATQTDVLTSSRDSRTCSPWLKCWRFLPKVIWTRELIIYWKDLKKAFLGLTYYIEL